MGDFKSDTKQLENRENYPRKYQLVLGGSILAKLSSSISPRAETDI